MKNHPGGERGFVKMIVLIVIALLVISYFGINLRELVSRPTTQDNIGYAASTTVMVWNNYLKGPVTYLWQQVFVELVWKPAWRNITTPVATTTPKFDKETLKEIGEDFDIFRGADSAQSQP